MSDLKTLAESPGRCPYCGQPLQKGKLYGALGLAILWVPLLTWKESWITADVEKLGGYVIKRRRQGGVDALCCRKCKKIIVSLPEENLRKGGSENV